MLGHRRGCYNNQLRFRFTIVVIKSVEYALLSTLVGDRTMAKILDLDTFRKVSLHI